MSLPSRQMVKLLNCRVGLNGLPIQPDLPIDEQFERAIFEFRMRGYALHSWTLSTSPIDAATSCHVLTLVAVFEWQNPANTPNYTGIPT